MNEDSTAEQKLTPANNNIYYCLATLHGEIIDHNDGDLIKQNSREWQIWLEIGGLDVDELRRSQQTAAREDQQRLVDLLSRRMGVNDVALPNPGNAADFSHTHFTERLELRDVHFPAGADFRNAVFEKGLILHNVDWRASAQLDGVQSPDLVGLDGGNVSAPMWLRDADIANLAIDNVIFTARVRASNARIAAIEIAHSQFQRRTTFTGTKFDSLTFRTVAFDRLRFEKVIVEHPADIQDMRIQGASSWVGCQFKDDARIQKCQFLGEADFGSSRWAKAVSFIDTVFKARTIFANSTFSIFAPDFRGAVLHEATELHGIEWPPVGGQRGQLRANLYAYERLKQEMERLKKHEDEQFFFRKELRVRRTLDGLGLNAILNFLYAALSSYGSSVARPLAGMAALGLAGSVALATLPVHLGGPLPLRTAAKLGFLNLLPFLPGRGRAMASYDAASFSWIFDLVTTLQALGSGILLFLIALALRTRFRMK